MTQQFLIQVEMHPQTRALCGDEQLAINLQSMVTAVCRTFTSGPIPAVRVLRLVDSEDLTLVESRFMKSIVHPSELVTPVVPEME